MSGNVKAKIDQLYRQFVEAEQEHCNACGYPVNVRNVDLLNPHQ